MVSVSEATEIILANLYQPKVERIDISRVAGKVLAEEIFADRDFPPFNRVAMDGIAIQFKSWQGGQKQFLIEAMQAAGEYPKRLNNAKACIEVMTGAMLPEQTDTVVRYEDVEIQEGLASINAHDVRSGQNVHYQGEDEQRGDLLLEPNILLSSAEVALLASVGMENVSVFTFPKVAIVSSGNELVEVHETPKPFQIRRSNSYALNAAIKTLGGEATLFHVNDQKQALLESLQAIVAAHDVVILSGGVSKGKFDFIPEVLEEIGIKKLFHQVSQRPGKPFWFGTGKDKVVFALPGNPVSTYMCFYRYIKPWLRRSLGVKEALSFAILAQDFTFHPKLTHFLQVKVFNELGKLMAHPATGGGSGDFANLKDVDGFIELPLQRSEFKAGEAFPYFPFRL